MARSNFDERFIRHAGEEFSRLWPSEQFHPPLIGLDFLKDDRCDGLLVLFGKLPRLEEGVLHEFGHASPLDDRPGSNPSPSSIPRDSSQGQAKPDRLGVVGLVCSLSNA